jgi:hypothetical protein
LPASLPGIAISNKTCYKDQFKGQKVKNERVASMKGNLSLGTLPFLSKTSSEAYAPKQGITRNITFQEEKVDRLIIVRKVIQPSLSRGSI